MIWWQKIRQFDIVTVTTTIPLFLFSSELNVCTEQVFECVNVTYSLAQLFTHTIKLEEENGIWMRYVCLGNNAWGVFVSKKMWRWPNTYANFFCTKFAFITRDDGKEMLDGVAWSGHWASLSCSQLQFTINTHTQFNCWYS